MSMFFPDLRRTGRRALPSSQSRGLGRTLRRRQGGLTLVELVVFIVIISVALTGVLVTFDTVVRSSADPMVSRQLQAIAEAMLEEVLLQDFKDPDDPGNPGGVGKEASRALYDDVDDYLGFDSGAAGITYPDGTPVNGLGGYRVTVKVEPPADAWGVTNPVPAAGVKLITVTASRAGQSFALSGYRTQDPEPAP